MKKAILLISILMASLVIAFVPSNVSAIEPSVTQVQTARGTASSTSLQVSLPSTPASGDVLVAVIGWKYTSTLSSITGISQGDIQWSEIYTQPTTKAKISVYMAIVPDSGSKPSTMTVSFTGAGINAVADVCEYSGLNLDFISTNLIDGLGFASTSSGTSLSTGTAIPDPTSFPYELWVGGVILAANGAQSDPLNDFIMSDGNVFNNALSVAYLEKIVSTTDTAISGTTGATSGAWAGVIITLPAAPTITLDPELGPVSHSVTMTGDGFTPDSDITATFDGNPLTLIGTAHTDAQGHFVVTFTVPSATPGPYTVTATDENGYSASEQFTVTIPPVPESPIGVIAPIAAIGLAFVVWTALKRSKGPVAPSVSI
jgi:hypothetical protein